MPPADLPGFYFDVDRNRYFPLSQQQKRSKRSGRDPESVSTSYQDENQERHGSKHKTKLMKSVDKIDNGVLGLIHQREMMGHSWKEQSRSSSSVFQQQYFEMHTFQPRIWKYRIAENSADGGLEQLQVSIQTGEGELEADVMILGGSNGHLGVWQKSEPLEQDRWRQGQVVPADRCLPSNPSLWTGEDKETPVLWPFMKTVVFPSKITSIKRFNEWPDGDHMEDGTRLQQSVMITTLGNGSDGGSLYLMRPVLDYVSNPLQQYQGALPFRLYASGSTNESVWTAESNPRRRVASLGMSSGAATVDLESTAITRLCRHSSAVLAQQFDSSGNVLLCGFRNGAISTIDLRQARPRSWSDPRLSQSTSYPRKTSDSKMRIPRVDSCKQGSEKLEPWSNRQKFNQQTRLTTSKKQFSNVDNLYCSHSQIMLMESAICSLALLRSSEWYLLASAMNGEIQQWDRRMVRSGAVRSYHGHFNTHTVLQLGLDPTERLLVSGGEDCSVRVWSMASGCLLHVEKGLTSPATTASWPRSFCTSNSARWGGFSEESPFLEDNTWALWMGSASGLLHMSGAAR